MILPRAVAGGARLLDREEALRDPHFAAAVARRALLRLRSRLGAAAVAGRAFLERGNADLGLGAARRFLEARARGCSAGRRRDRRRCRGRRAARRRSRRRCRRTHRRSRRSLPAAAESARAGEARRRIDARMTELVVGRALLGVGEDLVGFLRFLEFVLGALLRIAIRMVLHRELPIGLLDRPPRKHRG